jgi:hypothetical protein
MFEKFMSSNAGDFRQRYEGTYGFYRDDKGKRILTQLSGIGEDVCNFVDAKGVDYRLNADSQKDIGFEFIPPKSQYYNTSMGAVLVLRLAARQFQRGISPKNISINQLVEGLFVPVRVGFTILAKVYEQDVSVKEAWAALQAKKTQSCALSNQLAMDTQRVWLFQDCIGSYTQEGTILKIKLNEPTLWSSEVRDACRALEFTAEIS